MLYAHLNKFIDISKDIHPAIENSIFNYIESNEALKTMMVYPIVQQEGEESHMFYPSKEWIKPYSSCILSWIKDKSDDTENDTDNNMDKIAQWKQLNEGLINNGK